MELKNARVGILIEDCNVRRWLAEMLIQNGAMVICARNDEEMEVLFEHLNLDIAIVGKPAEHELFGLN